MRTRRIGAIAAGAFASALSVAPAVAGDAPAGPCSPYHAADGDIPSEMPGCVRHRRPVPGSLDDELDFARRRRGDAATSPDDPDDEAPPPRHRPRHRYE